MINVSHICQECDHHGTAGNTIREYSLTMPIYTRGVSAKEFPQSDTIDVFLCWPCAERRFNKYMKRKFWTMRDKAHG